MSLINRKKENLGRHPTLPRMQNTRSPSRSCSKYLSFN